MNKIAIVTDSNSGITQELAKELGIFVLPMPFYIDGKLYLEGVTLSQQEFYDRLNEDVVISTSQPSPADVTELWEKLLKKYEEVVYIPMSSGLSASCHTAQAMAQEFDGKIHVIDNLRISVTQYQAVQDAMKMASEGYTGRQVKDVLEKHKLDASIYITVETLKYLKKGGRITPAAAALGTILNLKPVLQIQGEKLDAYAKVRGKARAKKTMLDAVRHDLETRFQKEASEGRIVIGAAYAGNEMEAIEWKKTLEETFPQYPCYMAPLSLSVACHIGHGALAACCYVKY